MKKLLTLLLSLLLTLTLVGCTNTTKKVETTETKETSETLDLNLSGKASDMNPEIIPPLQDIDTSTFYDTYRKLEKLIEEDNKEESFKAFDELLQQMKEIDFQFVINNVYHSENVLDDEITDTYNRSMSVWTECDVDLFIIGNKLVKKYGQDFKKHLNNDYLYGELEEADDLDDEIVTIQEEITQLQNEYLVLTSQTDSVTVNYKGKDYTYASRKQDESLTDDEKDEIWLMLVEKENKQFGEVYLKLIEKNNELAKKYGYDNYPEYADKKIYGRDYTQDDLKAFYKAVENAAKEFEYVDVELTKFNNVKEEFEIINKLTQYMPKYAQDTFVDMVKNKLFVFGDDEKHQDGGYSYALPTIGKSYIYYHPSNDLRDIQILVHEIGHSSETYVQGMKSGYGHFQSFDVAETHSAGLEMLMLDQYKNVMDVKDANLLKTFELQLIVYAIIDGCIFDEWQRKVYTTPGITLDEINNLYYEIYSKYYPGEDESIKYYWAYTHHNFTSPMYYISYATSFVVAAQIYDLTKTDREKAVKAWESLIESGMSTKYMEAVKKAGLTPFNDVEATTNTLKNCIDEINKTLKELSVDED